MSAHTLDVSKAIRAYATAADAARAAKRTADQARKAARVLFASWQQSAGQTSLLVDGTAWGLSPSSRLVIPAQAWHELLTAGKLAPADYLAPLSVSRDRAASVLSGGAVEALSVTVLGEPDLRPC